MSKLSSEVTEKIHHAIKAKLTELKVCVDEELPEYVMVLVANRKTQSQLNDDLVLFLGDTTELFTNWLVGVLQKLEQAGKLVDKKNIIPEKPKPAKIIDTKLQKKKRRMSSGSENELRDEQHKIVLTRRVTKKFKLKREKRKLKETKKVNKSDEQATKKRERKAKDTLGFAERPAKRLKSCKDDITKSEERTGEIDGKSNKGFVGKKSKKEKNKRRGSASSTKKKNGKASSDAEDKSSIKSKENVLQKKWSEEQNDESVTFSSVSDLKTCAKEENVHLGTVSSASVNVDLPSTSVKESSLEPPSDSVNRENSVSFETGKGNDSCSSQLISTDSETVIASGDNVLVKSLNKESEELVEEFPSLPPSFYTEKKSPRPSSPVNELWSDISEEEIVPQNDDESEPEPSRKTTRKKALHKKRKKKEKRKHSKKEMEKHRKLRDERKSKEESEEKLPETVGKENVEEREEEIEQVITLDGVDPNDSLQAEIALENETREKESRKAAKEKLKHVTKKSRSRSRERRHRKEKKRHASPKRKPSPVLAPKAIIKMSSLVVKPTEEFFEQVKSVHSIIKVRQRPSLPLAMQANTTLILKAVADAHKSLESGKHNRNRSSLPDVREKLNKNRLLKGNQKVPVDNKSSSPENSSSSSSDSSTSSSSESEPERKSEVVSDVEELEINDNTPTNSDEESNLRERLIKNMRFRQKLVSQEKSKKLLEAAPCEDEEYGPAMPPSMVTPQNQSLEASSPQRKLRITVRNQDYDAGRESPLGEEVSFEPEFIVTLGEKVERSYSHFDSSSNDEDTFKNEYFECGYNSSVACEACGVDKRCICVPHDSSLLSLTKSDAVSHEKRTGVFARLGKSMCQSFPHCSNRSCPFIHPEKCQFGNRCFKSDCLSWHPDERSLTENHRKLNRR